MIMGVIDAWELDTRVDMIQRGVAPPGPTAKLLEPMYGRMSEFAHHRRQHIVDSVSQPQRVLPIGPHPDVLVRAEMVHQAGLFVGELVIVGGDAIAQILGREWFLQHTQPTLEALQQLRDQVPIDARSLAAA
jgi:hypothetical protein